MKIQDLRAGNYLTDKDGNIFKVEGFKEHCGGVTVYGNDTWMYLENLNPITLTEEILLNCGFEENESWGMLFVKKPYIVYHDKYLNKNILGFYMSGGRDYVTISKPIKHLHQLQNLYWCLCGEELIVNL